MKTETASAKATGMESGGGNAVKRLASTLLTAERVLMGLLFLGFGINGFFGILPHAIGHDSAAVGGALEKASCLFPLLKGTEVLLEVYVKRGHA